jgi:arylsulfatase A-like enzyme
LTPASPRERAAGAERPDIPLAPFRAGFAPLVFVLGFTLPCLFVMRSEQYLYYVRPLQLLPLYATAWLLLAALLLAVCLPAALALSFLRRLGMPRIQRLAALLLWWTAGAAGAVGVLYAFVTWLQTFAPALGSSRFLTAFLVGAAAVLAGLPLITSRGCKWLLELERVALRLALLGGLLLVTLPFYRWGALAGSTIADAPALSSKPNILLITVDALSARHTSLYGAERSTTPNLDAFARGATVFDHAYANSNFTTASVSSIMTGTRPWTNRALQIFSWPIAATRRASLPALIARAGYQTGYVATNSYAGASRLGLGPYFDFRKSDQVPMELPCPDGVASLLRFECPAAQLPVLIAAQKIWNRVQAEFSMWRGNRHYDPGLAVESALAWLGGVDRRQPVFLWMHLFPPHAPYAAPTPWLGRFDDSAAGRDPDSSNPDDNFEFRDTPPALVRTLDARYDEAVLYVDHYLGDFLPRALRLLGDNTVVVITADHGESFANGYGGHGGPGLFDSIVHVPLVIKLPRQTAPVRVAAQAELVDVAPTIAALAGITVPPEWEGRSLLPLWQSGGEGDASPPAFIMNFEENRRAAALENGAIAVIAGPWKLVHYMGTLHYPEMPRLRDELYELDSDPGEMHDRAEERPEEVRRLLGMIDAGLGRYGGAMTDPSALPSPLR